MSDPGKVMGEAPPDPPEVEIIQPNERVNPALDITDKRGYSATVVTTKTYHNSGIINDEIEDVEKIIVKMPPSGVPIANVGVSTKMVINMGNYESIHLSISVELPCVVEELSDAFDAAQALVDSRLNAQVASVRDYRSNRSNQNKQAEPKF